MSSSPADNPPPRMVRIVGDHSNVGKTTLIELLLPLLALRDVRVATIKHTHHGFDLDHPGKDSSRHAAAGAVATLLIGPSEFALLARETGRIPLAEAVVALAPYADVVLAEGFRSAHGPSIHLDPAHGARLEVDTERVTVGVAPDQLTAAELELLVTFCLRQELE